MMNDGVCQLASVGSLASAMSDALDLEEIRYPVADRTGGPTVVVAEDDDVFRALVCATLRTEGYTVVSAVDGRELLEVLATLAPDPDLRPSLVVSDVWMPRMTGVEALRLVRPAMPDTPIVLMTAFGDSMSEWQGRAIGSADILHKPFDLEQLVLRAAALVPRDD